MAKRRLAPLNKADAAELYNYAVNEYSLDRQYRATVKNLMRKLAMGTYKAELAHKAFIGLMNNAARKYTKDYGGRFSPRTRAFAAAMMLRYFESEARLGNYNDYIMSVFK